MLHSLEGKRVAFLAASGFEQSEFVQPWEALRDAGADTELVSLETGAIQGMKHLDKADRFLVDKTVDEVSASDYDGLVLPGGLANPDALRSDDRAVSFVRDFFDQQKPIAAICHAPWTLIEADVVKGRTLTSFPSLQTDIRNAGGTWVDVEVQCDAGLVTSRNPDDLDAFCRKIIEELAEGTHASRAAAV